MLCELSCHCATTGAVKRTETADGRWTGWLAAVGKSTGLPPMSSELLANSGRRPAFFTGNAVPGVVLWLPAVSTATTLTVSVPSSRLETSIACCGRLWATAVKLVGPTEWALPGSVTVTRDDATSGEASGAETLSVVVPADGLGAVTVGTAGAVVSLWITGPGALVGVDTPFGSVATAFQVRSPSGSPLTSTVRLQGQLLAPPQLGTTTSLDA